MNQNFDERIYIQQPKGFIYDRQDRKICELQRSIYGLKQKSCSWNTKFNETVKTHSFLQLEDEPYEYKLMHEGKVVILILYEDNILLIGSDIGNYLMSKSGWQSIMT